MRQDGEGLRARIQTQVSRGLDRRQERAAISARLRAVTGRGDDDLAVLRRLAEGRQPRAWHL
jgi:predicted ATPase